VERLPEPAPASQQDDQVVARHGRRQDERQRHREVHDRSPPEGSAGEEVREGDAERRVQQGRDDGDAHREDEGVERLRGHCDGVREDGGWKPSRASTACPSRSRSSWMNACERAGCFESLTTATGYTTGW